MDKQNITQIITDQNCTGCSACMNVCPTMALFMRENDEGFIMPEVDNSLCISCGKCVHICPPLHLTYAGNPNPACYAFRAADDIRFHSSSGGFFTVAAKLMFSLGGHVCGAIYDQDFNVRHTLASCWEQAAPMRSSKYVQSAMDFTYKKIRTLLGNGEHVLFTGTPCQVAGLNAYIGETYDSLFTIDLVCHGVPPQRLFKQHLSEIAKGRTIKSVDFRDKRHGWTDVILHVEFMNGESYIGRKDHDVYEDAFYSNLFLRNSCYHCPFCDFPRQGDLTMGDFWGYDKICPDDKSCKATSLILVNSEKGKNFLEACAKDAQMLKEANCDVRTLPNRLYPKITSKYNRTRLFHLLRQGKSFNECVSKIIDNKFDVGCIGLYSDGNWGSVMTDYALYHVLEDMGQSVLMIDRPMTSQFPPVHYNEIFAPGSYPDYARAPIYPTRAAMRDLNRYTDTFIVGSDQLYNPWVYNTCDRVFSLDWVQDHKKKFSYAASFGKENLVCSEDLRAEMSYYLKKFDAFSVREKTGIDICKQQLGIDAVHVMDPVFLCNPNHYHKLANLSKKEVEIKSKFLSGYILDPSDEKQKVFDAMRQELNIPYRLYTEYGNNREFYLEAIRKSMVNEQLRDIINCDFFVTDSFHGTCFSIILRKNFVVFANINRGYTRFVSILSDAGLSDRLVHSYTEFMDRRNELLKPIDYDQVNKKLTPLVDESRKWLCEQLQKHACKPASDYDIFVRKLADIWKSVHHIEKLVTNFQKLVDSKITSVLDDVQKRIDSHQNSVMHYLMRQKSGYNRIDELSLYLRKLNEDKLSLIILIAAKDTPANILEPGIEKLMKELGLTIDLDQQVRKSYIAALDGGKPLAEIISNEHEAVDANIDINSCRIELVSASHDFGNKAEIRVNGNELAVNSRGLNFVILDSESMLALDSVAFDTWLPHAPAFRND